MMHANMVSDHNCPGLSRFSDLNFKQKRGKVPLDLDLTVEKGRAGGDHRWAAPLWPATVARMRCSPRVAGSRWRVCRVAEEVEGVHRVVEKWLETSWFAGTGSSPRTRSSASRQAPGEPGHEKKNAGE